MLQLGPVYLNVLDLPRLSQFYQEVVGLSVLSKTKEQIVLGIQADQKPLVILQQATKEDKQTAGLYHWRFWYRHGLHSLKFCIIWFNVGWH